MDGLSKGLREAKEARRIFGCRVTNNIHLSHLMFVDDFMGLGEVRLLEWNNFHQIITKFQNSSSLILNKDKSKLISNSIKEEATKQLLVSFGSRSKTYLEDSSTLHFI